MLITLESHHTLTRRLAFSVLAIIALSSAIATILHYLEPNTSRINLIAPPLLFLNSGLLYGYLYRHPHQLTRVIHLACLEGIVFVLGPSWWFTLRAFLRSETTLIDTLPPLTSALFLLDTLLLIALRPKHLMWVATLLWIAIAGPILTYLLLNSDELLEMRGLDLLISLGPVMGIQLILIGFYNRLRQTLERLYSERLHYYGKILERQAIRQRAVDQMRDHLHNGPLQSLAMLLRDLQAGAMPKEDLIRRLEHLNGEIRAIGSHEAMEPDLASEAAHLQGDYGFLSPSANAEASLYEIAGERDRALRLGEGSRIDLDRPLHYLLSEVYVLTLRRSLPYLATIRVKVRNFAAIEDDWLSLDAKRELCLWLEEALCNVGKHARGATRLTVTGHYDPVGYHYSLTVRDNGAGGIPRDRPARLGDRLATQLKGQFQWHDLDEGGVLCQLTWPVNLPRPQAQPQEHPHQFG